MSSVIESIVRSTDRKRIAEALVFAMADAVVLSVKTRAFAWNVTGPFAASLRPMLILQHKDMEIAVEEISMRIRFLGNPAPTALGQLLSLSNIREESEVLEWREMISQLVQDQAIAAQSARQAHNFAELTTDTATQDLVARRIARHERNAWELRALLE
jgi:starvation-inducible DNA-binding protein